MKKRFIGVLLASAMAFAMIGCGDSASQTGTVVVPDATEEDTDDVSEDGTFEFVAQDDGGVILNAENATVGMTAEGSITVEDGYVGIDIFENFDVEEEEPCVEYQVYPEGKEPTATYYSYGSGSTHLDLDPGEYIISATVSEGTATGTLNINQCDGSDASSFEYYEKVDNYEEFASVFTDIEKVASKQAADLDRVFAEDTLDLRAAVVYIEDTHEDNGECVAFGKAVIYYLTADGDNWVVDSSYAEFIRSEMTVSDEGYTGNGIGAVQEDWIESGDADYTDLCEGYEDSAAILEKMETGTAMANEKLVQSLSEYNSLYNYSFQKVIIDGTEYDL